MSAAIGSLFSGYGGLDLAAEHVFGARTVWQAEWEDAPSKVLARHWPGVPNLRDVTAVDWAEVEPVDIIIGGFPCQDVSLAGRRAGMTEGTRSNLWGAMRSAVEIIRPTYVVAENVRGLLSAHAESASDMEPREGLLGDRSGGHLRALGRVLGDLADLGYDAQWCGLRASDVGAPHHRFRVFILARDAHAPHGDGLRSHRPGASRLEVRRGEPADRRVGAPDAGGPALGEHPGGAPAEEARTHTGDRPGDPHGERSHSHRRGTPADADGRDDSGRLPDQIGEPLGRETPAGRRGGTADAPDPASYAGRLIHRDDDLTDWGPYAAAVHRWEPIVGRRAPAPTELTDRGKHRLSPAFTEWMMGLPAGWITDTPGITRNDQLKMCGNGVVPQQAAAALHHMLTKLKEST